MILSRDNIISDDMIGKTKNTSVKPFDIPFKDMEHALDQYFERTNTTDADKTIIIKYMLSLGLKNSDIRYHLEIRKNYIVSRLIKAASLGDDELHLWQKYPEQITLGHIRVLVDVKYSIRLEKLKEMAKHYISVRQLIKWKDDTAGGDVSEDKDTKRYERLMSEYTHRDINIKYNNETEKGVLTLSFFGTNDLDDIAKALGFDFKKANDEF